MCENIAKFAKSFHNNINTTMAFDQNPIDENNNINNYMNKTQNLKMLAAVGMAALTSAFADAQSRGIGKYPGNPAEDYAPAMVADNAYRNVALNRLVAASSQYDYNLTPQLITDGIVATTTPQYLVATTNTGTLPRREREWGIDGNEWTNNVLMGANAWLQYDWQSMTVRAEKVRIVCTVAYEEDKAKGGFDISIQSRNGAAGAWKTIAQQKGSGLVGKASKTKMSSDPNKQTGTSLLPVRTVEMDLPLSANGKPVDVSSLRFNFNMPGAAYWQVTQIKFYVDGKETNDIVPSREFTSAWRSANGGEQWATVDLGANATVDKVVLSWIDKAAKGSIQVSADNSQWTTVAALPGGKSQTDNISFKATQARYVRVLMTQAGKSGVYTLSEMQVMGRGGLVAQPHAIGGMSGHRYLLNGGQWQLARASQVKAAGEQVASESFNTDGWISATVPGTVLTSYVNIGAVADPNIADNIFNASESFFNSNFWYRTTFDLPASMKGRRVCLNFDGINWKANIYLNGKKIDRIEGAFLRGKTDVTKYLRDKNNVLAVEIVKNAHPGSVKEKNKKNTDFNGGVLGYDNPTFHATIGWDWITTVRGRDIGIWNDVALTASGDVTLADPLVSTTLAKADTLATMTPAVVLTNQADHAVSGTLRGWIGNISFEKQVSLEANAQKQVEFSPAEFAQLKDQRMNLWWPNGYGSPYLYKAGFEFKADGAVSDAIDFNAGIREVTYRDIDTRLTMYVNGKRVVPLGGNWGFSEHNLCYRGREYDIAVRYHRDMNFNMIRNWVGMIGDEEFYDACDKYGIMVWQDFWLANPADGPDPLDEAMFLNNARDYTARMRNHASISLYCGRNEGYPPATIDKGLRQYVAQLNPGLGYISSSADDGVSGHGPYWACPAKEYFERQTGKLHSERGMPNIMTIESLNRTIAPDALWPQSDQWGQHDFCQEGAQRGASFNSIIERAFGPVQSAEQFASLAQWENYEGYRAMYESNNHDRQGLLIWMSHSCWPSMTWMCYDYYFEPTAAFFGSKKACEPVHIQWNAQTRNVEVINNGVGTKPSLTARRQILTVDGKVIADDAATVSALNDSTVALPALAVAQRYDMGERNTFFVKLSLSDAAGNEVSNNFYVLSNEEGNTQDLNSLPRVGSELRCTVKAGACATSRTVTIENTSASPVMMIRLNLKGADGEQILPVDYSDNYFHLMPGEKRTVSVGWNEFDARQQQTLVEVSAFNADKQKVNL